MSKEKVLYRETYRSGAYIKHGLTPVCRHQKEGFDLESARLLSAGTIERAGEKLEFHDIRVYFKERSNGL